MRGYPSGDARRISKPRGDPRPRYAFFPAGIQEDDETFGNHRSSQLLNADVSTRCSMNVLYLAKVFNCSTHLLCILIAIFGYLHDLLEGIFSSLSRFICTFLNGYNLRTHRRITLTLVHIITNSKNRWGRPWRRIAISCVKFREMRTTPCILLLTCKNSNSDTDIFLQSTATSNSERDSDCG